MKTIIACMLSFLIGMVITAASMYNAHETVLQAHSQCREDLNFCKAALNDPHSCVSIVVEILEERHETITIE